MTLLMGCASKRKKKGEDPSALSKFYHNTTALYNGYFNANELMKDSYLRLRSAHKDNYTEILPLYDYVGVPDTKMVAADLDKAIEKVTTVAALHKPSKWVDDCYVLMGEAQYLKQDYESAEETFEYFKNEFNPTNPFGRNYKKKKKSKEAIKKEKEKERKEEQKLRDKKKEEEKEAKERATEERKKAKEEAEKAKKEERERKKKEREEEKKRKAKERKQNKGKKRRPKKQEPTEVVPVPNESKIDSTVNQKPMSPPVLDNTAEEEVDAEEEVTAVSKKKKAKKKKDNTAYSSGMMWYAKTLVQRDKYATASYQIKRMRDDGAMPDDALMEVPVILADINIREKNYFSAIENLTEAIELADNKNLKARYAFVQGQLHMINKDYIEASESFGNAKKWAKTFKLEFMSELNAEKTQMMSGSKSNEGVIDKLDKMIKEAKYLEYLDQLYFTKGEIQLESGALKDALESFSLSIANNNNNTSLKQETYYKLAYLFYDKEEYVFAKNYFDSTLQVLEKTDKRYNEVDRYAANLANVATNIEIIKIQDSLLSMVSWSDERIQTLAEKLVEEDKLMGGADNKKGAGARKSTAMLDGHGSSLNTSNFFAYDPMVKARGQKEFKEKWGDVVLEDNWRRKDKSGVFGGGEDIATENKVPEDGFEEDEIGKKISYIKSQIPYGDEARNAANVKLQKAFFELGKAYRDKIQNYTKASETHETLLQRYPDFNQELDVFYYLYLTNLDLNNSVRAEYYKNKILNKYPDTEYAKAISDPNYGTSRLTDAQKLEKYYEETYNLFERGAYQDALNQADQAESIFGKTNALRAKFGLIKAMATGSVEGKEAYIVQLRDVITRYPNTPEKARADEILRFLQGDGDAFTGISIEEVDDIFSLEDTKLHYVAVVMYSVENEKLINAKISVSNYNKKYHKLKKLQLGDSPLDREKKSEIILVRKFENREKAMSYYNEVIKSQEEFISGELGAYTIYPITQRNYRKMIIEKSDARYRVFFNKHYLGK